MLSAIEQDYFARQIILPQIGEQGQQKWLNAHVAIIGLGGLGCPVALYLAAAGIGQLTLIDGDNLDRSNLSRQILYSPEQLGENKAQLAADTLQAQFEHCTITPLDEHLTEENAEQFLIDADIVIDCSDNMPTRYLINKVCHQLKHPLVIGAATGFDGQHLFINPNDSNSACYECLYPRDVIKTSNNCQNTGIINAVLAIVAGMQSLTCLKWLAGIKVKNNQLALFDGIEQQWQQLNFSKQSHCCICNK